MKLNLVRDQVCVVLLPEVLCNEVVSRCTEILGVVHSDLDIETIE